ncbi:MAG TPA: hemolysin family protein [Acidimicrobiales bacterium]|nr:hemolysin family protein [Acidimicrobiales bacterium]
MAGRRANRPPPDGEAPRRPRRRLLWRRGDTEARGRRARRDAAYEHSDAAEQERVIVEALGDLRDMDVREVMTPRTDVVALSIPVSAEDVARAVRESGHSAYPVVNGGLDDVVGVLYVNDLFRTRRWRGGLFGPDGDRAQGELPFTHDDVPGSADSPPAQVTSAPPPAHPSPAHQPVAPRPSPAKTAEGREPAGLSPIEISRRVRQAYVVPESRPILAALVEMRRHRRGFAVVVDEYGGVSGVLTVKDLLEPIVGELHDELDVDEGPSIVRVDSARWLVDGQTNVDEVRERLDIAVPDGEYVTIGGFVLDALGHIPVEGESVRVDGWDLTVQEMDKRRIAGILVRRRPPHHGGSVAPAPPAVMGPPDAATAGGPRTDTLTPVAETPAPDAPSDGDASPGEGPEVLG